MQKFAVMLGAALVAAGSALAQTAPATGTAPQEDSSGFATGQPVTQAPGAPIATQANAPAKPYVKDTSGDWEIRCVPLPEGGKDHCQLYQLLRQPDGTPIVEVSMGPLPTGQAAVAGAVIITPLETLLPPQLTMQIDAGEAKRYPFAFCNRQGCVSRVGFTAPDLAELEKGSKATLTIYSIANPKAPITIEMSLKGFSKGYDSLLD